jgi:hypothetical protein
MDSNVDAATVDLGDETYADLLDGGEMSGKLELPAFAVNVLGRPRRRAAVVRRSPTRVRRRPE